MEEAKNIRIHLTRSASAMDLKLSHVPKNVNLAQALDYRFLGLTGR